MVQSRCCKCVLLFLICLLSVVLLGRIVRSTDTDQVANSIHTFYSLPEDSLDVIGYGSSHMWYSFNPVLLYDNYGINAYNYGGFWQHMNTTKLFIDDSLLRQSPKVILIETYLINDLLIDVDLDSEIYYTRYLRNFVDKVEYLNGCFEGEDLLIRYLTYVFPLFAFHENWVNVDIDNLKWNSDKTNFDYYRGYSYVDTKQAIKIDNSELFNQEELSKESIELLDEIVNMCEERDIKIIFYTAPYEGEYKYSNALKNYAENNNCVYFDFFLLKDEIGLDEENDFKDYGHLNVLGANKVTKYIGEYIIENFSEMEN